MVAAAGRWRYKYGVELVLQVGPGSGGVAGGSCRGGLIAQAGGRTLTVWIGICALGRGHINFFVRVVLASAFFPMPSI